MTIRLLISEGEVICESKGSEMDHEYNPNSSSLSTEVWAALLRQALLADGRSDAFEFALKRDGNLGDLKTKAQEVEERIFSTDPDLKDRMAPGASTRVYQDGYLAGLKEAINIVSAATVGEEKQAV